MVRFVVVFCSVVLMSSLEVQTTVLVYVEPDVSPGGVYPAHDTADCFNLTTQECVNSNVQECLSLTTLVDSNLLSGNIPNVTILFLPGIHSYRGAGERVISIKDASAVLMKAVDPKDGATVICCNNSKGITMDLRSISNVVIDGITFEGCGTGKTITEHSTLNISYSINVTLWRLSIKYCRGIAVNIEHMKNTLVIRDSTFIHNQANLYIFTCNVEKETSNYNKTIMIINSHFNSGQYHNSSHSDTRLLFNVTNPGVTMILNQTMSYTTVNLINVSMHVYPMDITSTGYCHIHHCMNTTSVYIDRLWCKTEYVDSVRNLLYGYRAISGLNIDPRNYSSDSVKGSMFGSITIKNSCFNNSRVQIGPILRSERKFQLMLANVSIQHTINPLTIVNMGSVTLHNITIMDSDEQVRISKCKHVSISHHLTLQRNKAQLLFFYINTMTFHENSTIFMNFSQQNLNYPEDWPFYIIGTNVQVCRYANLTIINSVGFKCGGMVLEYTNISFEGESSWLFHNNTGRRGGAMVFKKKSKIQTSGGDQAEVHFLFINNNARKVGGAIFVTDTDYITKGSYLNDDVYETFSVSSSVSFYFENNTAGKAGSAIYGGWLDKSPSKFTFGKQSQKDISRVSSDPIRLCFCLNSSLPNCNTTVHRVYIVPGETFSIGIVAVGQEEGVVPASVSANFLSQTSALLEKLQYSQDVENKCTNLEYTVLSTSNAVTLQLTVASTNEFVALQHDRNIATEIFINIYLKNCSLGFYLDHELRKCQCQMILPTHGITCNLTTFKIIRRSPKWIYATFTHLAPSQSTGVIVHDHCPFDYCKQTKGIGTELNLIQPDQQCAFNRSGILCGACKTNLSRVLGTSKCKDCTGDWLALIVPLMVVAGLALVLGLLILNLTVSVGTINGLIFYANILRANNAVFFPYEVSNSFLSWFIAWLNLDLGIETCFYNGLNGFQLTWFQFLFPLYIWLIVITIIVTSHYSTRVSKLCGRNAVQVLATLFLLSYAKLLRIVITVFSATNIDYPNGYREMVWLYDGNVQYLKGKHIYLFVAAFVLVTFVSLPYTAMLLFVQVLQKFSNYKVLSWVTKLHPLFDAYTGPYKSNHRYWTGLLLLARVCLFLVFSLNALGDPTVNLLAISLTALILCGYNSIIGGVYRNWMINLIEVTFILNVGMLSAMSHYQISNGSSLKPVTYTSTGMALLMFVAIVLYHIKLRIVPYKWGRALVLKANLWRFISHKEQRSNKVVEMDETTTVTTSSVDLRELLLST